MKKTEDKKAAGKNKPSWRASVSGKNKYVDRILSDSQFRFLTTSALSGGWNLVYALYHIVLAVWFHSFWFLTMGLYYLVACGMRASALHLSAKSASERAAVKRNALLTFLLAFIFIGVIFLTIAEKHNSTYNIIVAISMAVYTFSCTAMAIRNLVRLKKQRTIQTILLRTVSMAYALGAMFGLERMMLGTFANPAERFTLVMEAASGAGLLLIIVLFGVNLLILETKMPKDLDCRQKCRETSENCR